MPEDTYDKLLQQLKQMYHGNSDEAAENLEIPERIREMMQNADDEYPVPSAFKRKVQSIIESETPETPEDAEAAAFTGEYERDKDSQDDSEE